MIKRQPLYIDYLNKYVRIFHGANTLVGKLEYIDFEKVVLSPHLMGMGTELRTEVRISNCKWTAPYGSVDWMEEIEDGQAYMQRIVEDAELKNQLNVFNILDDLKKKGIQDQNIENKVKLLLNKP